MPLPPYRVTRKALRDMMLGLYYPAVLGAGIVFLLLFLSEDQDFWERLGDFRFWFGLLFVMFFSFSYFTIGEVSQDAYSPYTFVCDIAESILVFCAFAFLGLSVTPATQPHRATTYYLFAGTIGLENVWSLLLHREQPRSVVPKLILSAAAILWLLLSAVIIRHIPCGNAIALVVLYCLFAIDLGLSFLKLGSNASPPATPRTSPSSEAPGAASSRDG